jgi:hypothetical protein
MLYAGKTTIIKKPEPYDCLIRVVVTVCPNCGGRLMKWSNVSVVPLRLIKD